MTVFSVASQIVVRTFDAIYSAALTSATAFGLDTTTWRAGDPTKAQFQFQAETINAYEQQRATFVASSFLSTCPEGDWQKLLAHDVYGVDFTGATFATSLVSIQNTGGGIYPIAAGDLTFKSSLSGKTYHNTAAGPTLTAGFATSIAVTADEAGSASSAGVDEIDTLVTSLLGVVVLSSTVAVGVDEQTGAELVAQCEASRGALSPNGPADAYEYVARSPALTGVLDVSRAASDGENATLTVTVYLASPAGAVAGASVTAVQAALEQWATPLTVLPTAVNSTPLTVNVTASTHDPAGLIDHTGAVVAALGVLLASLPIGKGAGYDIDPTTITTAIRNAAPAVDALPVFTPTTPIHVAAGVVPVLGTVTLTAV